MAGMNKTDSCGRKLLGGFAKKAAFMPRSGKGEEAALAPLQAHHPSSSVRPSSRILRKDAPPPNAPGSSSNAGAAGVLFSPPAAGPLNPQGSTSSQRGRRDPEHSGGRSSSRQRQQTNSYVAGSGAGGGERTGSKRPFPAVDDPGADGTANDAAGDEDGSGAMDVVVQHPQPRGHPPKTPAGVYKSWDPVKGAWRDPFTSEVVLPQNIDTLIARVRNKGKCLTADETRTAILVCLRLWKGCEHNRNYTWCDISPHPLPAAITMTATLIERARDLVNQVIHHYLVEGDIIFWDREASGVGGLRNTNLQFLEVKRTNCLKLMAKGNGTPFSVDTFIEEQILEHGHVYVHQVCAHVLEQFEVLIPRRTMDRYLKTVLGYEMTPADKSHMPSLVNGFARLLRYLQYILSDILCELLEDLFDYIRIRTDESFQHVHNRWKRTLAKYG